MEKQKTEEKFAALVSWLARQTEEPVCLAFSGGVDSSLLLKLACTAAREHGTPVYAVTFDTMLHPACDVEIARRVAGELGAIHEVLQVDELEMEELRSNPPNRCYLCKHRLFETLLDFAGRRGIRCVMDGTNEDDLHVYRPGLRALAELGIVSPLAEFGIRKDEVKSMAARLGISVAARPSTPCMATRLPYGAALDYPTLRRIEEGEKFLRTLFSGNVRLRLHGPVARIELDPGQMGQALAKRETLCDGLRKLGFVYVTLDLEGFRSGSMDIGLETEAG